MAKVVIELSSGELEIDKELGFGLQYSIGEIQDPSKRNTPYSKTIVLPGTKNNNFLLGNLFDINEDFTYFNPNIKTPAKIIVDSTTVIDGFLQLKNIISLKEADLQGNFIQYNVVIKDSAIDFFGIIADKYLTELDFSEFDHTYAFSSITPTWVTGRTATDGYCYPLMYNNSDAYETKDFKPAIFHKAYLEKIAVGAGFSLGGTFMDNEIYKKEIIPFNGDIPVISPTEYQRRLWRAGMSVTGTTVYTDENAFGGVISNVNNIFTYDSGVLPVTHFDNDTTDGNFDPNGHYDTTLNKWTIDRNGNYNIRGEQEFETEFTTLQTVTGVTVDGGGKAVFHTSIPHRLSTNQPVELIGFTAYTNGTQFAISNVTSNTFRIFSLGFNGNDSGQFGIEAWAATYTLIGNAPSYSESTPSFGSGGFTYRNSITMHKNGATIPFATYQKTVPFPTSALGVFPFNTATYNSANNFTVTRKDSININKYNTLLLPSDEVTFKYQTKKINPVGRYLKTQGRLGTNGTNNPTYGEGVPLTVTHKLLSGTTSPSIIFDEANTTSITDGDPIFLNDYIPAKIKQKDIIIDLVKRYNLYISVDPDNDKKLILDTRDEFYAKGVTLDWTQKKDFSSADKIELLSQLQNKEMLFTYATDDDEWNKNYSLQVDEDIYGQKLIEFDNEFVKGTKKIETPFSPTPLVYNSINRKMIVPSIKTQDPKNNMRVLYYAGLTDTLANNSWSFKYVVGNNIITTGLTQYPYAGHYDNPITPSLDINFGEQPFEWYAELASTTNNTLFGNYWRNYVNQIAEGKLLTAKFYLTEVDIQFIKNNMNAKIFIKDAYYNINKIQDYNPAKTNLTKVQLIKIIEGVPFTKTNTGLAVIRTGNSGPIDASSLGGGGAGTGLGIQTGFDTSSNDTQTSDVIISGDDNQIGSDSTSTIIEGSGNRIGNNVTNSGILGGSGNTINPEVSRSWVIGSNDRTINNSDEIWIGDINIINGVVQSNYNLIDGGENALFNVFSNNIVNYIDGGENEQRAFNSENPENYIDGGENEL